MTFLVICLIIDILVILLHKNLMFLHFLFYGMMLKGLVSGVSSSGRSLQRIHLNMDFLS